MFSPARIVSLRKSKGFSQELLAEQSGVSLRTIQRVEQGETVPRGHTVQALATALEVPLEVLLTEPAPAAEVAAPIAEAGTGLLVPAVPEATLPAPVAELPAASSAQRPDPHFLQLLNLSALSFLVLPFLNLVVPWLLWRARRHDTEHADELGRRVLGFQILWQVGCFFVYLLAAGVQVVAAKYFHLKVPGVFLGIFVLSYALNALTVVYYARRLQQGHLDVYRVRL